MTTLCTNCGFDNPPGMRFCGNCGTRLADTPAPTPSPTVDSPTTDGLGVLMGADLKERLHRAGIEAAGQRRRVTVLFTDLSGYTALSERMDSEDIYNIIQQYIRALCNSVYKYEGIVDKLTGDGLMALFGAPIMHENNAERAVRAALDMQADVESLSRKLKAELGVELNMRVGLHSGEVIVGGIGSDLLLNYTAVGDTVNLAHRIEEAASPGTILISEPVYRQVRAQFDCQQVSYLYPKGIAHPVAAYRLLALKTRPGTVRGLDGLRAPMIGRDPQLTQLREVVANLVIEKQGQLAVITGEAGLGKSRLVAEFKAGLPADSIRFLEGQSLAYRRAVSYWMFMDVFYSLLGVSARTDPQEIHQRLVREVYQIMGSQSEEILPYLEHMLSLPYSDQVSGQRLHYLDAGQLRKQIFLAVRDLLVIASHRQPLIIVLDDLHWADDASLDLMMFLAESLRQAPIFLIAISREILPGTMTKMIEWAERHLGSGYHSLPLQSLSMDQSAILLQRLLSIPDLPERLRQQILQRAAGIPFYLEEILRMLIDEGAIEQQAGRWSWVPGSDAAALGVPDTLQGLILARFDRLESFERRVLQVATVIGKNFSLPVLEWVLEPRPDDDLQQALSSLSDREFIQSLAGEQHGPEQRAEEQRAREQRAEVQPQHPTEFTFRHILMSDAIYSTLLRRERSRLHGKVGEAIEKLYADRLEGQIELLANHYRFSPRLDRALHYLILAGQKAARNNVNEQARQHFEAALEILGQVEPSAEQVLQVQMGMGDALVFTGEYPAARKHYLEGLQALDREDAPHPAARERSSLYRKLARTYERHGDYEQAVIHLTRATDALDISQQPHPVDRALIMNDLGWIHFRQGNFPEAQQILQAALDLVKDSNAYDTIASIENRLGGVAYNQGNWDAAAGYLRESIAMREAIRDVVGLSSSFNNLGYLEVEMGELDHALENLTRCYELKSHLGEAEGIGIALNNLGWLHIQRGEIEKARQLLFQALDLARQIGYSSLHRQILKNIGELNLTACEWAKAQEVLCELVPALESLGAKDQLLDTYRLLGESALGLDDLDASLNWEQKALDLIDRLGSEAELSAIQRGEIRRFRGMLAMRQGDYAAAEAALRESEAIFNQLGSRLYQGRVACQFGALSEAQGDLTAARKHYETASQIFRQAGALLEQERAGAALQAIFA